MSIKIILENINCHSTAEFVINKFQTSLLKGASGIGKSSIFQAFTWCLYGKLRGVCTFGETKYSVTLIFDEFTIYRRGKPRLLQISITGNPTIYEDEVAEKMIDQYFGTEDIWYASCYIEQDTRSPLLSGTNSQRMDLLNKLSFWSDNPDYYLDKIDEEIKIQQSKLMETQTRYRLECDLFTQQLNKRPIDMSIVSMGLDASHLEALKGKIKDIEGQLTTLNLDLHNQQKIIGSLDTLKLSLSRHRGTIATYKSITDYDNSIEGCRDRLQAENLSLEKIKESRNIDDTSMINQLQSKLKELESLLNQRQLCERTILIYSDYISKYNDEYNKLRYVIDEKEKHIPPDLGDIKYNRNNLSSVINQEQQRLEGVNVCLGLNIEYDVNVIKATIDNLSTQIKNIQLYKMDLDVIKNIEILKNKLNIGMVTEPSLEIIKQLELKYNDMLLSKGVLQCPHCKGALRYTNYTLKPESTIIYSTEEINATKLQLDTMKKDLEKYKLMCSYQAQIDELVKLLKFIKINDNKVLYDPQLHDFIHQIDNYNKVLYALQKIKYVEPVVMSSNILLKIIEYQEATENYQKFIKSQDIIQYRQILDDAKNNITRLPVNLEQDIINTKKELNDIYNNSKSKNSEIDHMINKIQINISNINNEINIYINKRSELGYLLNQINENQNQIRDLETKVDLSLVTKIDTLKQKIIQDRLLIDNASYYLDMMFKQQDLTKKANDINISANSMADLYGLRQTTFDLECNHLQTTVDSINESMNSVLEDIFDKPIKVILQLYKKNKTNEKIKASVNLNIQYDGNEYDSINKLSGGEKDRVSFALTLALSRINGCPLLFLDETMTSLNDTLRTACVDGIKKFLGTSKTVVCINHEDVEGNYDSVIELR